MGSKANPPGRVDRGTARRQEEPVWQERTMAIQRRWKVLACAIMLVGIALAGVLVHGSFGVQRPGGNPMKDTRFMVDHVRLATDKPFEEVTKLHFPKRPLIAR